MKEVEGRTLRVDFDKKREQVVEQRDRRNSVENEAQDE